MIVSANQSSWACVRDTSQASKVEHSNVGYSQNSKLISNSVLQVGAYSRQPKDHTSTLSSILHCEGTSNSSGALYGAVQCACSADLTHSTHEHVFDRRHAA